jgi:hypothetical protein
VHFLVDATYLARNVHGWFENDSGGIFLLQNLGKPALSVAINNSAMKKLRARQSGEIKYIAILNIWRR